MPEETPIHRALSEAGGAEADDAADYADADAFGAAPTAGDLSLGAEPPDVAPEEVAPWEVEDDLPLLGLERHTRAELYELAQERKIAGRSRMSREQLIEALRRSE